MMEGAVFGELVLLGVKVRQESVVAKTFVELEVLTKVAFDRLLREHDNMQLALQYVETNASLAPDLAIK